MRFLVHVVLIAAVLGLAGPVRAQSDERAVEVARTWYRLTLELVRHTPTYSPPVASRSLAYLGVAAQEGLAGGRPSTRSFAGQLNGLEAFPPRSEGVYDKAVVLQSALTISTRHFFSNTGPTGQRAMDAIGKRLDALVSEGADADVLARSLAYGRVIASHVIEWSADDGGAVVENMGFPHDYVLTKGPQHWVPTSLIAQQQAPLLPNWGTNRTFAMPDGATCGVPPPPDYSEEQGSAFHNEAVEVYEAAKGLTPEQREIARFWSDDPMLSPTPPGHWISIALQLLEAEGADAERTVDVLARLGIVLADSFIGCWEAKYRYDLVRPVTYIRRHIDAKWQPDLITPPFPEYPSGHSTQSGAAAIVLENLFGATFAFEDETHVDDGLPPRHFESFREAAEEAAISRLYGGIHYRAAIERGLEQGYCIGAYTNGLVTRGSE
ncbi:vanadium-dependent haloperoxidase [Neoaquamicrobium sediminum]|uniref:vanadium-dependent haloperoxidase n=1 Tax=Neoaquamicrobium sediminum TaxID=1849104 RepID=UPI0015660AC3|nr:vanadium-dependent haloperoxidase [Mesorhizobium sediminum]NRC54024.1 vanadium-dependent haloperoxidase [Mesorhizobium sediminum]